ncbi:hypothetical protein F511_06598 [Dorcoceras hygrometricum]|uniref:Uncharacterized protein n=1 Tax=Dorcoceras hygrometricum TaxID=472368 RepID=A0A2Z7B5J3_9LAMI|nr:hypothetical protein F511_06598 [Dorcoceras hygrometricum]
MASSFYSNSQHVDFDSVLAMDDQGMVSMFQGLMASGLAGFLGCPAVIYETALIDFFENASVRDGILFSTFKKMVTPGSKQAKGFAVQISLLLENIPNLELGESSEFPASKILTEKTVHRFVSLNDKAGAEEANGAPKPKAASKTRPVVDDGAAVAKKKRTIKKKSVTSHSTLEMVAVAQEIVPLQMVEPCPDVPAVEEHVEQPAAEEGISTDQPVEVGVGEVAAEIDASAVRDKPADTNKESQWFDLTHEELIAKWAAERIITSPVDTDEEIEAEKPVFKSVEAVKSVIEVEEAAADKDFLVVDDPDTVINQVLQQLDSISADRDDKSGTGAETWFYRALGDMLRKYEGAETMGVDTAGGDQQVQCSEEELVVQKTTDELLDDDEQKLLEDILLTIPVDIPLPSASMEITKIVMGKEIKIPEVTERTWFLNSLPKIPADHKGKAILEARQEGLTTDDVQTLRFNEFRKNILAQNASIFTGLEDVRKELLEFQSKAQENQNILHAQLSELVNYINRGSADKKGESSSRGPQQPPNVQIRDSGTGGDSAVRTPTFAQRVEMTQRRIVERVLDADRNSESLERQAAAERDRERRRREAIMLKRRRKF